MGKVSWSEDALKIFNQIPFFVRGKVRKKVEEWAQQQGLSVITPEALYRAKRELKDKAASAERGYAVEACFGRFGCSHAITNSQRLIEEIEKLLEEEKITEFLLDKTNGKLKHHNQFRIAISECPNACSRVHIADFGIIGVAQKGFDEALCNGCGACIAACPDNVIGLKDNKALFNDELCSHCIDCIKTCKTKALSAKKTGYRVLIGGKLGRHPRLATPIAELATKDEVLRMLQRVIFLYKRYCKRGERLGKILSEHPHLLNELKAN